MRMEKLAGSFAMGVGASMIGMWTMLYFNGDIVELAAKPVEIGFHLAAEGSTALLLVLGGFGLIRGKIWGRRLFLFSEGMLVYTLIQSPGYYLAKGEGTFVVMFLVLLAASIGCVNYFLKTD